MDGPSRLFIVRWGQYGDHFEWHPYSVQPDGAGAQAIAWADTLPYKWLAGSFLRPQQLDLRKGRVVYPKELQVSPEQADAFCRDEGYTGVCATWTVASYGIAIAHFDGSDEQMLTTGGYDIYPALSPDGEWIAFQRHLRTGQRGGTDAVALIGSDGRGLETFKAPPGCQYSMPNWSPDGRSIAAVEGCADDPAATHTGLVIIPFEGAPVRTLAPGQWGFPTWSHDGKSIAALGTPGLVVVPADGGPPRQLAKFPASTANQRLSCGWGIPAQATVEPPVWSPDDRTLAFSTAYRHIRDWQGGQVFDVDVINADGTGLRVVQAATPSTCGHAGQPETLLVFDWVGSGASGARAASGS